MQIRSTQTIHCCTPQLQILFAVLEQALADAGVQGKLTRYSESAESIENVKLNDTERAKSRRWIMTIGGSFADACELLGIDASAIRRGLRKTTKWAREY